MWNTVRFYLIFIYLHLWSKPVRNTLWVLYILIFAAVVHYISLTFNFSCNHLGTEKRAVISGSTIWQICTDFLFQHVSRHCSFYKYRSSRWVDLIPVNTANFCCLILHLILETVICLNFYFITAFYISYRFVKIVEIMNNA